MRRKITKAVKVGGLIIGGGGRVAVQSMTNTPTADGESTLAQTLALKAAGCDIVRIAVSGADEVKSLAYVKEKSGAVIAADIQFDYKLGVLAAEVGADKVRFNPGNIGGADKVKFLIDACKANRVPVRIGVNAGSLEKGARQKFPDTARALAESACKYVGLLEKFGFYDIIVSVKASGAPVMFDANLILADKCGYPLHLGVTESGLYEDALVKSAAGIGGLLLAGVGDTVRVSVTGDPVREVYAAKEILRAAGLDKNYCEVISCPTCSRCKYDLETLARRVKERVKNVTEPMKIAVMGCAVNGPGEAKDADFGIACGDGKAALFVGGAVVKTVALDAAYGELEKLIKERASSARRD